MDLRLLSEAAQVCVSEKGGEAMNMNLESELRMRLKAMMYDMQSPNPFKSLDEKKVIIERYVRDLLDMLQESYGKVPEQGKRENGGDLESHSRWARLFGTPERAARTVLSLDYCCEDCDKCPAFEICGLHSKFGRTVYEMTEWLRSDTE